ncbi:hypothetical protein SERLADRAFT_368793 [Serpula lacrymans var. lacrymans S7.9]|nr:uncharacterized protein SERLADRAFT_368793 [Serpula lacrymans var. lacrymans S7.9]EGO25389.1 hypothetical protein SERLADRAFT_368793 [Serpula lacrymans var. lacrymans S7.9]
MGDVTVFRDSRLVPDVDAIRACYLKKHPDARWWLPDDDKGAHISYWARFDPHDVYFVGGFGGEHYIGQIPLHLYQGSPPILESEHGVAGRILIEQL